MPEFYSVQEFAKITKMNPVTIRKAIETGYINAFKPGIGKRCPWRIPATEIERLQVMRFERMKKVL